MFNQLFVSARKDTLEKFGRSGTPILDPETLLQAVITGIEKAKSNLKSQPR